MFLHLENSPSSRQKLSFVSSLQHSKHKTIRKTQEKSQKLDTDSEVKIVSNIELRTSEF